MDYSDCASQRRDVHIAVAENQRTFRLHNPAKRLVVQVKVDGCLMPHNMERCDYLFEIPGENDLSGPQVFYAELKGKDVLKAISQIRSTMDHTRYCHQAYEKICCVVASRIVPAMRADIQAETVKLRKNYQAKLRVASQELQVEIE